MIYNEFDSFINSVCILRSNRENGIITYCYMVDRFDCPFNIRYDDYSICNCVLRGKWYKDLK